MKMQRILRRVTYVVSLILLAGSSQAGITATAMEPDDPGIAIIPCDAGNLMLDEQIPPDRVIVRLSSPVHNWFCGTFAQLPTHGETVIGFSLAAEDAKRSTDSPPSDVRKWEGLRPLMTYADPAQYTSYEWFHKQADGMWVSGDPFKRGAEHFAGNGRVPVQQAMPATLAEHFLSPDGTQWVPWREVDAAHTLPALNIFRITQVFQQPTATVAMRVPFTDTFLQAALARLNAAKFPGVYIDVLGTTPEHRQITVIRIEDPAQPAASPETRTILLTAREHATEHASSWAAWGALTALISETPEAARLRHGMTWLILPIQDPDGSATSTFDRLTNLFACPAESVSPTAEVSAYARYLANYIYAGHTIDLAVALHNVEANEGPNLLCPYVPASHAALATQINKEVFATVTRGGFVTGAPDQPWTAGSCTFRLFGWCAAQFGSLDLAFEVNDRYPTHPLSLPQLQALGGTLATGLAAWLQTSSGDDWHRHVVKLREMKVFERSLYYRQVGRTPTTALLSDVLSGGF